MLPFPVVINLATLFIAAPLSVMPLLPESARMDLIDLFQAGMEAQISNRFGGTSRMTHLSDTLLTLEMTDISTVDLRLTPDSLVSLTHTVQVAGHPYQTTTLYNLQWKRIR